MPAGGASSAPSLEPVPTATEAAHAQALQLLDRHGVITREAVLAEGVQGGYASVYGVLKVLEERGRTRRGYFVAGLGAAQFALPGAVERLRGTREAVDVELDADRAPAPIVLAATDPAQPYGAALAWPDTSGRPARSANALVVAPPGDTVGVVRASVHHLVMFPGGAADPAWADALAASGLDRARAQRRGSQGRRWGRRRRGRVRVLRAAGFVDGYRGLVIRS